MGKCFYLTAVPSRGRIKQVKKAGDANLRWWLLACGPVAQSRNRIWINKCLRRLMRLIAFWWLILPSVSDSGSVAEPSTASSSPTWRNTDPSRDSASKTLIHTKTSVVLCEHTQRYIVPLIRHSQEFNHTSLVPLSWTPPHLSPFSLVKMLWHHSMGSFSDFKSVLTLREETTHWCDACESNSPSRRRNKKNPWQWDTQII